MEDRLSKFYTIYEKLPKDEHKCLTKTGLLKHLILPNKIGSGLFGDVYGGKLTKNGTQSAGNVSKLKVSRSRNPNYDFIVKTSYKSPMHLDEANMAEDVSKLVYQHICPHFPLSYGYYFCKHTTFYGVRKQGVYKEPGWWDKVKRGTGIIQFYEYAGISFSKFLTLKPSAHELHAAIAQVFIALYALHKHAHIHHNDLYFSNITMMPVKTPSVFRYVVKGKTYNIKVQRYYPILVDFGQSYHHNKHSMSIDVYTFLSDFSVATDGTRPSVNTKGDIAIVYKLPAPVVRKLQEMLKAILHYYHEVDTSAPYKDWLIKKYTNPEVMLQTFYYDMFNRHMHTRTVFKL